MTQYSTNIQTIASGHFAHKILSVCHRGILLVWSPKCVLKANINSFFSSSSSSLIFFFNVKNRAYIRPIICKYQSSFYRSVYSILTFGTLPIISCTSKKYMSLKFKLIYFCYGLLRK